MDRGLQTLWDVRTALGFDNDGDLTPAAVIAGMGVNGFCDMVLQNVREHVRDTEQAFEEYEAEINRHVVNGW